MSQYPPPQYPPPNPPPPGGGVPQYGMPPGAQASNGLAITALIMGILSCIPGVGLLAILFGALGIGKAKDPRYGGKGLAIVGIVLGLLSIVVWGGIGYTAFWGYGKLKAMAEPGAEFFKAVHTGDFSKAKSYATGNVSDADLKKAQDMMKTMGEYKDMKVTKADWKNDVLDCSGTVIFEKGTKSFEFRMVKSGDTYKVDKFTLD